MNFEEKYFQDFKYSQREHLIKHHVLEVLKWGAKTSSSNLFDGRGKKALDVGCAYGYAVDILKSLGYDSYGVDISKYGIEQAKRMIDEVYFAVCDVQKGLPFNNETFDLVTCFEVLEHLGNPLQAVRNMFYSCKNILVCTTPNRIVERPIKTILKDFDETHISAKAPYEWEKSLRANLPSNFVKTETFFDANLKTTDNLLFFKSFKVPYFGLNTRILIQK